MTMRDAELCALIDRESRNAIGVEDTFAADRRHAMEFYLGEAKGELSPPAVAGRSKVVSKDLMDTVEWAMPGIMESVTGATDTVKFKAKRPGDEQGAEDATNYVNYIINEENEGFVALHDAIKSCLITRMGVIKVYCDKSWEEKEERYIGLSMVEAQALEQDSEVEVVEVTEGAPLAPEGIPEGLPPELMVTYDVTCKRREQVVKYVVVGVPPEEIRISKDFRTIDDVRFICHEAERTRSDLISEGWPKDEVMRLPIHGTPEGEEEKADRHDYDGSYEYDDSSGDPSQQKVLVSQAYVRVDYNGDGVAEYRRVLKSGTYVHENEVVEDHPFALFTPILMPYKGIGLSFFDAVEDLQRINTVLTRQMLDNAYQANIPQKTVVEGRVNLDDLLNPRVGGIVRVKTLDAMRVEMTPFIGPQALTVMDHFNQVRDRRTGVTEMNSSLNADSLSKGSVGSEGVAAMMAQGGQRMRLIARVLAETGVKRLFKLVLKEVTQYQDRPAQIEVNGRWLNIDPREWKNGFHLQVSVGVGTVEKKQEISNLMLIGQTQQQLIMGGLIDPKGAIATAHKLAKAMGYRDPEEFYPPAQQQAQQPPEAVQVEQMKQQGAQQLAQLKAQADIQVARMTQEFQAAQAQQETQLEAERNAQELQNNMALEQYKVDKQMELEIAKAQIARQTAIDTAQISAQASVASAAMKPEASNGQD